uniref:Uncharacterized protein n=1 Tax=Prolemur simus TaxID=1328070 RepID=A0A8C8YY75_PROSS
MSREMAATLRLGLLLLALLLPMQIYANQTSTLTVANKSFQSTSAHPNPANATTKGVGSALKLTASLLMVSLSSTSLLKTETQSLLIIERN